MALPEQQQNTESKSPVQRDASTAAFEFVRELSAELSQSTIELPSFPEVAVRVQKALSEENCSSERVVRVIGAEPMLATRVLQMANSAALNPGGKPVAELRTAVTRLGFDALRAATVSFAMAQLRSAAAYKGVQRYLDALWQQSVLVASMCFVVARRAGKVNADTAMLTGLVHGVGKLYILTRSTRHPALFADQEMYQHIVNDWHGSIAKVLLENWRMADEIITAVHTYDDDTRQVRGVCAVLADVLEVAVTLAMCKQLPELLGERIGALKSAARLELNAEICQTLMVESAEELGALRSALGH
jgi:HD-like signal output (HDOD) protein